MEIKPITFNQACEFVNKYHRHHSASQGCKWCIGLYKDNTIIGCAICGRPVSRYLDDGLTCEITRLCTIGDKNACSKLYGACCRIAKEMGYKKIITYILESEKGTSLKAANFIFDGIAGGENWTSKREQKEIKINTIFGEEIIKKQPPTEMKKRYYKDL